MKEIWAYACELYKTTTGRMTLHPPVFGILDDYHFTPIGKSGKPVSSKKVSQYMREYADTYEEAKEKYNKKIDDLIKYYKEQIERLEKNKCV